MGSDQYGACNNYTLASGRELSFLDIQNTNNVCVLGGKLKESLFNFVDPVGQYISCLLYTSETACALYDYGLIFF